MPRYEWDWRDWVLKLRGSGHRRPFWTRGSVRAAALIVTGAGLTALGVARSAGHVLAQLESRREIASLGTEIDELERTLAAAREGWGRGPSAGDTTQVEAGIPAGDVPGPIVRELLLALASVGIDDYRYRVHDRVATDPRRELLAARRGAARPAEPGLDDATENEEGLAWGWSALRSDEDVAGPLEQLDEDERGEDAPVAARRSPSAPAYGSGAASGLPDDGETPDDVEAPVDDDAGAVPPLDPERLLYRWTVEVEMATDYPNVIHLLEVLARAPRFWRAPSVELFRDGERVRAALVLVTFTRPYDAEREAMPDFAEEFAPRTGTDPFQVAVRAAPSAPPIPVPELRAIRFGAVPRAWLGAEIVGQGEAVQGWTVEEIEENAVWIRHASGRRTRLALES